MRDLLSNIYFNTKSFIFGKARLLEFWLPSHPLSVGFDHLRRRLGKGRFSNLHTQPFVMFTNYKLFCVRKIIETVVPSVKNILYRSL